MKTNAKVVLLRGALVSMLFFVAENTFAMPKTSRDACGEVSKFDGASRTLVLKDVKKGKTLSVVLKKSAGGGDLENVLTEGKPVCIRYRIPLVGKPFAYRLVIKGLEARSRI